MARTDCKDQRRNTREGILRNVVPLISCIATLALIGCGSGSGSGPTGPTTYALGGTLSGLAASESVSLQDNGGDTLNLSANGAFSFPMSLNTGTTYAITVQSHTPGIACSVRNGSGVVGSSNVSGVSVSCAAGTESILHSFGGSPDGKYPSASLVMDSAGNLYGTTQEGGGVDGTVFKIDTAGTESVLYSFVASPDDGAEPLAGLIIDSAGNLYGTTESGGANNQGAIFKISATGSESVLYSFLVNGTDGVAPLAGLVMDSAGNLYGTTDGGGAYNLGTVFKIGSSGTETVLYSFGASATDGLNPQAGLIMDNAGNLYGTTAYGGANKDGTVFKISATGAESILYSFGAATADGMYPVAGVTMDGAGNLWGTTSYGGAKSSGTVFKIDAAGTETFLYSFDANNKDGIDPLAGLIMDSAGNLYGTTYSDRVNGDGTVFKISATGTETILYYFGPSDTDGVRPLAGLILDNAGNLYGTTFEGGANNYGTVFKID